MNNGEGLTHIVIYGGGLAGWMSACALRNALAPSLKITVIDIAGSDDYDMFYGTASPPASYNFNLALGVSEPVLLLNTATSFSYGTQYENWSGNDLSWMQCHHLPFPIFAGIPFTHYVNAHDARVSKDAGLEPYLASAQAALQGRFIHPPKAPANPMSRAEYGYQFSPSEWKDLFRQIALDKGARRIETSHITLNRAEGAIKAIKLADGKLISADFYIDCSGPYSGQLGLGNNDKDKTRLGGYNSEQPATRLGPPMRRVNATPTGWVSETYLQDRNYQLTIFDEGREPETIMPETGTTLDGVKYIPTGRRSRAWAGNCVAIGHSAAVIEPLTPAPIMLLQRDIERLLTLIPLCADMTVEARAYNQAFEDDYQHAEIFNQAFFATAQTYSTAYWQRRQSSEIDEKLKRKLTQFQSRGLHVSYDLEPFNEQDWAILHYGMKRRPERIDIFANLQDQGRIDQQFNTINHNLMMIVEKMPPHHIYMDKLLSYLKRKLGSHV